MFLCALEWRREGVYLGEKKRCFFVSWNGGEGGGGLYSSGGENMNGRTFNED